MERKCAFKGSEKAFPEIIAVFFDCRVCPPFSFERQNIVLDLYGDILLADTGQFHRNYYSVITFINVDGGPPGTRIHFIIKVPCAAKRFFENSIDSILKFRYVPERVPFYKCHSHTSWFKSLDLLKPNHAAYLVKTACEVQAAGCEYFDCGLQISDLGFRIADT
jgi:hypothetical protein